MGQNGTATSGRGLTGMQIVSTIRMVAMMHEKCDCECSFGNNPIVLNENCHAHAQSPRTRVETRFSQLPKEAYAERSLYHFKIDGEEVEVFEYAPQVFCRIRNLNCIKSTKFIDEWTFSTGHNKMKLSAGRSKAFFISSKNMLFLSKTIAKEESEVLADILESYTQYLLTHTNSFLSRFYMLLKMRVGKKVGYILCTSDVFSNATTLHEKWDIKGRMPKLGKFFYIPHLVPHTYDPNQTEVADHTIEERINNTLDITQSEAMRKQEVVTRHDKDLTRMFWIKREHREHFIRQLLSDYAYLASESLMDYSLLIGVSSNSCNSSSSTQEDASYEDSSQAQTRPRSAHLSQVIPHTLRRPDSLSERGRQGLTSLYDKGIPSVLNQEVYYIGIIDVLTRYTIKKKLANFCKSFMWAQKTLSTIPPKLYQRRINKYTQIIFPKVR